MYYENDLDVFEYSLLKSLVASFYIDKPVDYIKGLEKYYKGDLDLPFVSLIYYEIIKQSGLIDEKMKENMLSIISYLDFYFRDKSNNEKIIEILNELKIFVNSNKVDIDKVTQLSMIELVYLGYNLKEVLKVFKNSLQDVYDYVKDFRINEAAILSTHILVDDRDYFEQFKMFAKDIESEYIRCVNCIIKECPKLLKEELFIDRVNEIVDDTLKNLKGPILNGKTKTFRKQLRIYNNIIEENTNK